MGILLESYLLNHDKNNTAMPHFIKAAELLKRPVDKTRATEALEIVKRKKEAQQVVPQSTENTQTPQPEQQNVDQTPHQ